MLLKQSQQLLPLQMECTLYFEQNPFAYETVNGLALRLGRTTTDILITLEHLVSLKILEVIGNGSSAIYHYKQPEFINEVELLWNPS